MKDFWKKYKIYLVILIYLIIVGLVGFFIARPMVLATKEKSDQIQQKVAIQERKEEKLRELPSIRIQFEGAKKQEDKIIISLNKENVVSLVEKLEKISEETGNKINMELKENEDEGKKNSNPPKKSKEEKDVLIEDLPSDKYVKIKIVLYGRYENFLNFMNKVENMEFYSDVVSVAVKRAAESGSGLSKNPFTGTSEQISEENSLENKDKVYSQLEIVFYLENK